MKYRNASKILPPELLKAVQQYISGEYLYIPHPKNNPKPEPTAYHLEVFHRDRKIYQMYLEGVDKARLASLFHLSASSIRRILLAQRRNHNKMEQTILSLLPNWDIHAQPLRQIYDTVWQLGDAYVIKYYRDLGSLERNLLSVAALAERDIPVGRSVTTQNGQAFLSAENGYFAVYEKLKGSNLVIIHTDPSIPYKVGVVLAQLHKAMRDSENDLELWDNSLLAEMQGWVRDILTKENCPYIRKESFFRTLTDLENIYPSLPVQLIHRDVHLGNFLFDRGIFSGYVDFDLSQRNIRIFDLCYFLLGLLSEQDKLCLSDAEWFDAAKALFAGYRTLETLSDAEIQAVPTVMKSIELLFIAWFLQQKDTVPAEKAAQIYRFVEKNTNAILHSII